MSTKTKVNFMEFMLLARKPVAPKRKAQMKGSWSEEITDKQKETMHKFGIGYSSMLYRGQANIVIDAAMERRNKNLATAAQMRAMYIMGIDDVHKRTFKEAIYILNGNDPDTYDKLEYTFKFTVNGETKEQKAFSRKDANKMFQELRTTTQNIQVMFIEK